MKEKLTVDINGRKYVKGRQGIRSWYKGISDILKKL